jgi:hypothetical protein
MDNNGCPQWRLSLEPVDEDVLIHFEGPAEFMAYLLAVMDRPDRPASPDGSPSEASG